MLAKRRKPHGAWEVTGPSAPLLLQIIEGVRSLASLAASRQVVTGARPVLSMAEVLVAVLFPAIEVHFTTWMEPDGELTSRVRSPIETLTKPLSLPSWAGSWRNWATTSSALSGANLSQPLPI